MVKGDFGAMEELHAGGLTVVEECSCHNAAMHCWAALSCILEKCWTGWK